MTVVVKFGTSLVVGEGGRVRRKVLTKRAREIAELVLSGESVVVVSSGAIALGRHHLDLSKHPHSVPKLQAASALGQARLQAAWDKALTSEGLSSAQVLLTARDIADRGAYINARNVLTTLFTVPAVPIVNENDATATDEITFGDNDVLAAQVAVLVRANLLVLLTEVEGVYTHTPGTPGAKLISEGKGLRNAVLGDPTPLGKGGMRSKVMAAEMGAAGGIPTVIASGIGEKVLGPILAGEERGTRFATTEKSLSAYKLWLRFGKPVSGTLRVDPGARRALVEDGRSLLAVGVVACEGQFRAGEAVEIAEETGLPFAKGIADAGAEEIAKKPRDLEAVHRDRLVLY